MKNSVGGGGGGGGGGSVSDVFDKLINKIRTTADMLSGHSDQCPL